MALKLPPPPPTPSSLILSQTTLWRTWIALYSNYYTLAMNKKLSFAFHARHSLFTAKQSSSTGRGIKDMLTVLAGHKLLINEFCTNLSGKVYNLQQLGSTLGEFKTDWDTDVKSPRHLLGFTH